MKVFPYILVAVVCAIVVPCLVTFCVNGKQGGGNYKSVKARYERAVIDTKGKIIEQKENN